MKNKAKQVLESVSNAVIANQHSEDYTNSSGLQIDIPMCGKMSDNYEELAFAKDTSWKQAMESLGVISELGDDFWDMFK